METKTPIADWVQLHSQTKLASLAGLTQGGVRKMVVSERKIYVVEIDGEFSELIELKVLGSGQESEQAA